MSEHPAPPRATSAPAPAGERRLRVLVSAYACEPGRGSESGIGWDWVRQVARFHDVWVVTRSSNREAIEGALAAAPLPGVRWIYFDLPRRARFWKRGTRGARLYYYLWQVGAYFAAARARRDVRFDVAHHVTWGNYWSPSLFALSAIPFVWGPVGGGESAPRPFYASFGLRGRAYEHARDLARALGEWDPLLRATCRGARVSVATTPDTARRLVRLGARRVEVVPHAALPADEIAALAGVPPREGAPFRLVSVGRLLHWKGFHLGLAAFARAAPGLGDAEYWIVGGGPQLGRLTRLARSLGVGDRVRFLGALPRREVLAAVAASDVLLHPSLHDSGGYVCLEAMAAGRPVICLDLGGPGLMVTDDTGVKVAARDPEQAVRDLAAAITRLAGSAELRARLAARGRERVRAEFDWDRRGDLLAHLYGAPGASGPAAGRWAAAPAPALSG